MPIPDDLVKLFFWSDSWTWQPWPVRDGYQIAFELYDVLMLGNKIFGAVARSTDSRVVAEYETPTGPRFSIKVPVPGTVSTARRMVQEKVMQAWRGFHDRTKLAELERCIWWTDGAMEDAPWPKNRGGAGAAGRGADREGA